MSFTFRASLCLLVSSLSLISPFTSRFQSLALTPNPPQSSDDETLRRQTEQYASAIAAGDLEAMRRFWNSPSPNLASRLSYYQRLFLDTRIEFISLKVTRLEITGDRAVSHLTADERRLDKKTGAMLFATMSFTTPAANFNGTRPAPGGRSSASS